MKYSITIKRYRQVSDDKAEIKSTHYTSLSEKAQLELIKLAIHYPDKIKDINIGLFTNLFLHDTMKTIIKNYGKNNSQAKLLQMIGGNEEERNLIASLAIKEHKKEAVDQILKDNHEICSHGLRWINYKDVPRATEKEHMQKAIEIQKRICGERPMGWYTGRTSENTRDLVCEEGGFLYD